MITTVDDIRGDIDVYRYTRFIERILGHWADVVERPNKSTRGSHGIKGLKKDPSGPFIVSFPRLFAPPSRLPGSALPRSSFTRVSDPVSFMLHPFLFPERRFIDFTVSDRPSRPSPRSSQTVFRC